LPGRPLLTLHHNPELIQAILTHYISRIFRTQLLVL
jgi:hypothetical protein